MNDKENAPIGEVDVDQDSFDFDELERQLEEGLEDSIGELEFLAEDKVKISNPENLGNAVMDVVWDQFINQVGLVAGEDFIKENRGLTLDLRSEAHIQTTENFANGKIATHNTEIDYQKRYDDWQDNFQKDPSLKDSKYKGSNYRYNEEQKVLEQYDNRSGSWKKVLKKDARKDYDKNRPKGSKTRNMDEIIPAAEIIRDPEAAAHMTKAEKIAFDNSEINLNEMDSSANESKGDSTMKEWLDSEKNGQKPAERFDDIDEESLMQKDKEAREEYEKQKKAGEERSIVAGKKSQKEEAFRIGGKALRAAVMGLLAELVRNIIGKLVEWIKSKEKNLETFFSQIKDAIVNFITNIKQNLITAGTTLASSVVTAIFGPVVETIQKIWTMIKQGGRSVKEAMEYLKAPENRNKSFGVLMLEVSKIIMTGVTAIGAMTLGDAIEKELMTFPVFAIEIPLLGSLANIIGIFLGAVVAGIAGALVLNLIDKLIAKKKKQEITEKQIDKGNEVLVKQAQLMVVNQEQLHRTKNRTGENIKARHEAAAEVVKKAADNIFSTREVSGTKNEEIKKKLFEELDNI